MIDNRETDKLLKVIQDNFSKQVILEPKRENNILNLILTNKGESITPVEARGQLGDSDHIEIKYKIQWQGTASNRNMRRFPNFLKIFLRIKKIPSGNSGPASDRYGKSNKDQGGWIEAEGWAR